MIELRKRHKDVLQTMSMIVGPAHLSIGVEPDVAPNDRLHNILSDLVDLGFAESGAHDHYSITDVGRAALSLATI